MPARWVIRSIAIVLIAIPSGVGMSARAQSDTPIQSAVVIDWSTSASDLRGDDQSAHYFFCPPYEAETFDTIWGTDIYSDASPICVAAMHVGAITRRGGSLSLEVLPGRENYIGSERNGVVSASLDGWAGSYRIQPASVAELLSLPRDTTGGELALETAFNPLPSMIAVEGGGRVPVYSLGRRCQGYVDVRPTFRLHYTAGVPALVIRARSDDDTTLVVRDSTGAWHCDDGDGGYLFPRVAIPFPPAGYYDIWIGTRHEVLPPTEGEALIGDLLNLFATGVGPAEALLDFEETMGVSPGPAAFGALELQGGFAPDPRLTPVNAGGSLDIGALLGAPCVGYATAQPTLQVNYDAAADGEALVFTAASSEDTTLAVRLPSGVWRCDDNSGPGRSPAIGIPDPVGGAYLVWLGTRNEGVTARAALVVAGRPPDSALRTDSPARFGETDWSEGLVPEPLDLAIEAGGALDADDLNVFDVDDRGIACIGFVSSEPTHRLFYAGTAGKRLVVSTRAEVDTTLAVQTPSGEWFCDDDGQDGFKDAALTFVAPDAGAYLIYVGTFVGRMAPARLIVEAR